MRAELPLMAWLAMAAPTACQRDERAVEAPALTAREYSERIASARAAVERDPRDRRAWIELGNDYFDTQRRAEAVEAYASALELEPDDPDVLTDQGIMLRELGAFDRALANFERANRLQPTHLHSLFNIGVLCASDLHDRARAVRAWRKVIDTAPGSPQAEDARRAIDELEGGAR